MQNALVRRKRRDGACHLAGYAVERALKSCMIRRAVRPDEWFPAPDFSRRSFTHDLETLCILANLDLRLMESSPFDELDRLQRRE